MTKYHFNKDTGRTGKCEAKIKCRLGLAESEHFETKEEAQAAFEKTMEKKTVNSSLKKNTSKGENVDTHKFSGDDFGYPELKGKTAAEIRQYVLDIHDQYDGREETLKQEIVEQIGLSNIPEFNDDYGIYTYISHYEGTLNVDRDVNVSYYGNDDDYEFAYEEPDVSDYFGDGYEDTEGYISSELFVKGYYNEDSYVSSKYKIPESFNDDLEGLNKFNKYNKYHKNANNPNLPDWASLPKEITMDIKPKNKTNGAAIAKPGEPSARIKKWDKIIGNDKEVTRLRRANESLAKKNGKATEKLNEIQDYENSDNKRAFVFKKNPDYRRLSQPNRRYYKERLQGVVNSTPGETLKNLDKIKISENVTQADKLQAASKIREINKEYENKVRDYKIAKLSDLYPHSKESVRKKYATEWVDAHPDLSIDDL